MPAVRLLVLAIALAIAACATPTGASPTRVAAPSGTGRLQASPGSSGAGPVGSAAGGGATVASPTLPPGAELLGTDGGAVAGTLGSWTLDGNGSDSPWLPASALREVRVRAGARLEVRFVGGEPIGQWSAQAAAATDPAARQLAGLGGRETAEPALDRAALDALAPGRWVVAVRLELAGGRGNATWYWLVSMS